MEQIVGVLKQAQVGVPVAEVIRKAGISEQTFYRWKAKYVGLEVDPVRQMAQLPEENLGLKKLVAELTLDKAMLQDVLPPHFASLMGTPCSQKNGKAFAAWTDGGASGGELSGKRTTCLSCSVPAASDLPVSRLPRPDFLPSSPSFQVLRVVLWQRVYLSGNGFMGLSESSEDRLLQTGKTDGQCVRGKLQWNVP